MLSKSCGSFSVIRQGAEKASIQQYIGKYQINITNSNQGKIYSETWWVSLINKYVAKYEMQQENVNRLYKYQVQPNQKLLQQKISVKYNSMN